MSEGMCHLHAEHVMLAKSTLSCPVGHPTASSAQVKPIIIQKSLTDTDHMSC